MNHFGIELRALSRTPPASGPSADRRSAGMEFHIRRLVRESYALEGPLFSLRGNVVFADFHGVRDFAKRLNAKVNPVVHPERFVKAGQLNAMGLIDEILHYVAALYREQRAPGAMSSALDRLDARLGAAKVDRLLRTFVQAFPPQAVYQGGMSAQQYLSGSQSGESNRALALEELMLLKLANENTAFGPFKHLFDDADLKGTVYAQAMEIAQEHFASLPPFGPDDQNLWDMLRSPAVAEPYSLTGQLEYIRKKWGLVIGGYLMRILTSLDVVKEEEKPVFSGPGPSRAYSYDELEHEYERFSQDQAWMPRMVLMAKSTLVWLYQLSAKYQRPIERLDQIPDGELDELARRGFTGLWLIGLWERSAASKEIKRRCGNPEAAASAYSLHDYDIAGELGGWSALEALKSRCALRGIRLGSDMVPNHTGIDSRWVMEHPQRFLQVDRPPFPTYTFSGENLSRRPGVGVYVEDHYYDKTDAAVVFKRVDFGSGDTRYIYHGNDGTSMPWNDTAQIDFLNPEAREAVIRTIIGVCKQFPIVRFDAAMTLAKKHIQRLWYPEPGHGGDIASRSEHGLSREDFDRGMPNEFWREVVDRCAAEAPETLLLAEAFWMMEGYFVRTLGMHRVYNSAFMNMLKNEENAKYRSTIKNTLDFDPQILERFVNFMNNPDEDTAVAQFGRGDKYFGICTLMSTMPGLPMFGHGQIEGLEEKYGMEYRRAYKDESADPAIVERHEREIFPLLRKRRLFAGSSEFALFDLFVSDSGVNENVFAYSNSLDHEHALVLYNNSYQAASGWIRMSASMAAKGPLGDKRSQRKTLSQALGLSPAEGRFTLFREQRSDRWFIRSSKELSERGLFVALNGYQAQLFLDFHEVVDSEYGRWRRLCEELSGRGVLDVHAAFQDLFLRDLYAAFQELAKPSFFNGIRAFFLPLAAAPAPAIGATAAPPADAAPDPAVAAPAAPVLESQHPPRAIPFVEALREPTLRFIRVAKEYLDGASGRYESFAMDQDFPMVGSETAWESFALSVQRLLKLAEVAVKPPAALKSDGRSLAVHLAQRLAEDPRAAAYAAGYTVLSLLRGVIGEGSSGEDGRRLVDHWCLDRKLRESYQDAGFPADESHRMVELLKLVLSRTVGSASGYPYPKDAELGGVPALMHGLFSDTDTRSYLGVNVYQDASWFVKERFEESLFYAILLGALESEEAFPLASSGQADRPVQAKLPVPAKPGRSLTPHPSQLRVGAWSLRLSALAELRAQLDSVKEKSGYRVETFLELAETFFPRTEPVPAAKVPAASKPAAAKVPAASKPAAAKVPAAKESGTKKPQRTTKKT